MRTPSRCSAAVVPCCLSALRIGHRACQVICLECKSAATAATILTILMIALICQRPPTQIGFEPRGAAHLLGKLLARRSAGAAAPQSGR